MVEKKNTNRTDVWIRWSAGTVLAYLILWISELDLTVSHYIKRFIILLSQGLGWFFRIDSRNIPLLKYFFNLILKAPEGFITIYALLVILAMLKDSVDEIVIQFRKRNPLGHKNIEHSPIVLFITIHLLYMFYQANNLSALLRWPFTSTIWIFYLAIGDSIWDLSQDFRDKLKAFI